MGELKASVTSLKIYVSGYILNIKIPIERLIKIGRRFGMGTHVEQSKAMRI
jgi:hypothetical protein